MDQQKNNFIAKFFIICIAILVLCLFVLTIVAFLLPKYALFIFQLIELLPGALFTIVIICTIGFGILTVQKSFESGLSKIKAFLVTLLLILIILAFVAFSICTTPNVFKTEKDVRAQISIEQEILNKEYAPVLDYITTYKKEHKVYPENLDKIVQKSKTFSDYEYHVENQGKAFFLQVYPQKGPVEFYCAEGNDYNYKFLNDNGSLYNLGFHNYYKVDNNWHATMNRFITRYSFVDKLVRHSIFKAQKTPNIFRAEYHLKLKNIK